MLNLIFENLSKILLGFGILFLLLKIFLEKTNKNSEKVGLIIYNTHRASFSFSTIFAFIHGLTFIPINQVYILTGWLFGVLTIILCVMGIAMGFQSNWKPYNEEQKEKYKKVRIVKWVLTIVVIVFLGMHYLL